MLSLVQSHVRQNVKTLRSEFASAEPFRHVLIDGFLDPPFCAALIAAFPAFDPRQARNELGETGRKAVVPDLAGLGPDFARFDRLLRDAAFLDLIGQITGIPRLLYDPRYIGGGTHENLDGQELDPHVDFNYQPGTRLHRRLNLILYLNPEWDESWGGSLELHRNPWLEPDQDFVRIIPPVANRCVLFETTERSWHGFRRIALPPGKQHLSRRSVAVYYYTRERPPAETAPSHGTVYVPRPLPPHLRAGHTLSEADLYALQLLLARRDHQIQFLYEREKEYSSVLEGILRSPAFRLGRFLSWPLRRLRRLIASKPAG
ncbi:MAG TPA: 2OG-Fe(II) oxygenase [Bryobacteraceae bacterium]|nr:2OG-Fe(II) oxygenase [Bryobacteraceae bacterium]